MSFHNFALKTSLVYSKWPIKVMQCPNHEIYVLLEARDYTISKLGVALYEHCLLQSLSYDCPQNLGHVTSQQQMWDTFHLVIEITVWTPTPIDTFLYSCCL